MNILQHHTNTTNDLITAQAGLLAPLQLMQSLGLTELINHHLPAPKSNRGFAPSLYVQTLILLSHAGGTCLEDVKQLREDDALLNMLDIKQFPSARALGSWLHRLGNDPLAEQGVSMINQQLLRSGLGACKAITLDIDATEIVSHKKSANWTYNNNQGYMPMVGHIAETDQVLSYDFRAGKVPPNKDNLAFIQQCQKALPEDVRVKALRIDAAGYQANIIQYCDQQGIDYAIRAKMTKSIRQWISEREEADWQPVLDSHGLPTKQSTCVTSHCITGYDQAFALVIQRSPKSQQTELTLDIEESDEEGYATNGYIYRALATNRQVKAQDTVAWYNQRADTSENRIKELKSDFNASHLPCSDFKANALYFGIGTLAYNLFALMRLLAPELRMSRIKRIRFTVYQLAGKVVHTGRRLFLKLCRHSGELYARLMSLYGPFRPPAQPT